MRGCDRVLGRVRGRMLAVAMFGVVSVASAGVLPASAASDQKADKGATPAPSGKASASPTTAAPNNGGDAPKGNNGHIQIDEFVMDGGNGNDPHVPCGFSVSFFGYDAGTQHATITLTPWSPTNGGHPFTVSTDWHVDHRTSGNQLDKNVPIPASNVAGAFSGVRPAKQGYHAKIDVHVTGSQGSDAKHKVIWIEPCATSSTPSSGAQTSGASGSTSGTAAPSTPAGGGSAGSAGTAGVLGESITAGNVAPGTAASALNLAATTTG